MQSRLIEDLAVASEPSRNLYQEYTPEEETHRICHHYDINPNFFTTITGGEWHHYSCAMWEEGFSLTQAQEKKLDEFARIMQLKPGMHILEVGVGWGGPLVYLCHKYGVTGHGITVSPMAIPIAEARAKKYGVNATFEVVHWKNLRSLNQFDAIYSDEVLVHINDLGGFFKKANQLLKPGGIMAHKELHFTHSQHSHAIDKLSQHINKNFGYTGNYRTLVDELAFLDVNDFKLTDIINIPVNDYKKTISEHWVKNINKHKKELVQMTSEKHVKDFKLYLKGICHIFNGDVFGIHIIGSQKA